MGVQRSLLQVKHSVSCHRHGSSSLGAVAAHSGIARAPHAFSGCGFSSASSACVLRVQVFQRQLSKQGLSEALVDEVGQEVSGGRCLASTRDCTLGWRGVAAAGRGVGRWSDQCGTCSGRQRQGLPATPLHPLVRVLGSCVPGPNGDLTTNPQVRTFSRDQLRSLFKVDPTTPCDTHAAIACDCDGSAEAAAAQLAANQVPSEPL